MTMICEDCNKVAGLSHESESTTIISDIIMGNLTRTLFSPPPRHPPTSSFRFSYFKFYCVALLIISSTSLLLVSASSSEEPSSNTVVSQSEIKTIEPTNNPSKVFVRRRIFRKLVKDASSSNSSSSSSEDPQQQQEQQQTTTTRPRTLYSLVKKLDNSRGDSSVTGSTLKSSMSTSVNLSSKQKFNFASLKTRLGLAATTTTTMSTTTESGSTSPPGNDSLVMIPLPPNQRKPYTPVIMQVTKSTTSKPSTMQTYKLNKMFVPIGIYGKVLENGSSSVEDSSTTTTPTSMPATEIRHKGSDSVGERKHKGIAESVDLTYSRPDSSRISLTTEKPDIGLISITTEANELFGAVMNGLRRGDAYHHHHKKHQNQFASNSGLTLMTPPSLGGGSNDSPSTMQDSLASYASYATYSNNYNKNGNNKFTPSSMLDSITDSMSKIPSLVPSLFHKGLTSLTSLTSSLKENPFVDDNFSDSSPKKQSKPLVAGGYTPKIPASVPGGYINGMGSSGSDKDQTHAASELGSGGGGVDLSEYETLEYFRKRPHLLHQLQKQQQQQSSSSWRRSKGVRLSKGFKPATAPDLLAREYYKSTTTTQMTPETYGTSNPTMMMPQHHRRRGSKHIRGSWLLRNSNEYVANKNEKLVRMWRNMLESFTNDDEEGERLPQSTIASRRSSGQMKREKSPVLHSYWSSIKNKYSKDQINEAKERILTLLNSGYGDDALLDEQVAVEDHDEELVPVDYVDTASHMPPPPPPKIKSTFSLTKGLSGAATGAFKDLVKFFKLGVSVGAGKAHEPVNYENVVDLQEEEESEWKPVRRPLISFSAGISLKNPSSSSQSSRKPSHYHHQHIRHVHPTVVEEEVVVPPTGYHTETPDVVVPVQTYTKPSLTSYIDEFASSHHDSGVSPPSSTPIDSFSYANYNNEDVVVQPPPPQSLDYEDEGYESSNHQGYAVEAPARYNSQKQSNYYDYTTLRSNGGGLKAPQSWTPLKQSNLNDYELVPSSVYLNGQNDPRDIAAVVKPAGISDDLVRSALPAGLRNLRILDYPPASSSSHASLNSVTQALGGGGSSTFKHAMKKLRENYVQKESLYLPTDEEVGGVDEVVEKQQRYPSSSTGGLEEIQAPTNMVSNYYRNPLHSASTSSLAGLTMLTGGGGGQQPLYTVPSSYLSSSSPQQYYSSQLQQQHQPTTNLFGSENVFTTANRINNLGRGSGGGSSYLLGGGGGQQQQLGGVQKDQLGFTTDYNLPQHLDPDIAAILKSELDKDDIPEDVRQEFLEAKEQENKKKKQQQASRRVDDAHQSLIDSLLNTAIEKSRSQQQYSHYQTTPQSTPHTTAMPYVSTTTTTTTHQPAQSRSFNSFNTQQQLRNNVPPRFQYHHSQPPPPVVTTRFFAPIPITPTLMTTAMRNPRYSSPVPRYVIELAKKLQTDKSVQGIVRVSAKRGRGLPPIEYLYPVKG